MNQLTTLFFPDTVRVPEADARLLLFFEKIFHYLPAESEPTTTGEKDLLREQGLCQDYAPAPLGKDLDRFSRTLRDLQANLYDHGERLKQLAVASFAAGKSPDRDEISVSSLVAAMLANHGPKAEKTCQTDDRQHELWRARIILKLAESYDREKEEIDARLAKLARTEQEILTGLKGESQDERSDTSPLPEQKAGMQTKTDPLRQRMRAWTSLFLADARNNLPHAPCILSTNRRDACALLLEAYTDRAQRQPGVLFSLPVPDLGSFPAGAMMGKRDAFRSAASNMLGYLQKLLINTAAGTAPCPAGDGEEPLDRDRMEVWTEALRRYFPTQESPRSRLTVYCLENTTLTDLLARTFLPPPQRRSGPDRHPAGLIAYLDMS